MNAALKENVNADLEHAEEALREGLINGADNTHELRRNVTELKRNKETLADDAAAREQMNADDIEVQMVEQAEVEVQVARDDLLAELRERADILLPEIVLPLGIAVNVQRAGFALQAAQEVEVAAKDEHEALVQRFQKHETTRQSIIQRCAAGSGDDDADKADLLMATEDMNGLQPHIDKALTALQNAQASTRQMQAAFDGAMGQWGTAINNERRRATGMHCQILDAALVNSSRPVLGADMMSFGYVPSVGLKTLIQRFTG